jgi:hypothetical protein
MEGQVKRRRATSRKPAKRGTATRRKPKRNEAPTAAGDGGSSVADLLQQFDLRTRKLAETQSKLDQQSRELSEAHDQLTAMSEVLRILSDSATDLQMALGAIAESAARILDVTDAEIMRREGDVLRLVAKHGQSLQWPIGFVRLINRNWVTGRSVIDKTTIQVPDLQSAESDFPEGAAYARQFGHRTTLAAPLLREGEPIGAILIRRMNVRPFTNKQITLVTNFAAQAVIAIENARLFEAEQTRSRELSEALEQQTATSEVLHIISSSHGELAPVFNSMLENATRLCEAESASLVLREGGNLRFLARYNVPAALLEQMERDRLGPASGIGRSIRLKQVVQVPDMVNDQAYFDREPARVRSVEAGYRSQLSLPLIQGNEAIVQYVT